MADSSNTVNVRIAVPAVDLSGIDALIRRGDALKGSLDTLRQSMRETGKHLGDLPPSPGTTPTRGGGAIGTPAPPPSVANLQAQLQGLKLQQAQIDQATQPQVFREIDSKRRELERQLQRLTLQDSTRQREQAADAQRQAPVPVAPAAVAAAAVAAQQPPAWLTSARFSMGGRPVGYLAGAAPGTGRRALPLPAVPPPGAAPAAAQPGAAPAAAQPAAAPAPMAQRDVWRQRMQLAATEHRLANVQAQRARVPASQPQRADRLEREEARLQTRVQTLSGAIQAGQAAPPPEPVEEEEGGGRPPRRPPRPPQEPGDRMWSMARRGASTLGGAILGGGIASLAVQTLSMMATPLIDRVRVAMEKYENRVRGVGQLSLQLVGGFDSINTRLDTMRENYSLLASEGLDVMQGINRTVSTTAGAEFGAARFARAFGVAPGVAGEMQGRLERLVAPFDATTRTPLARVATAMRMGRPGIPDITKTQFVEQALGVAATGGTSVPQLSGDFVGRMTDFLGSLGARFPGQQANVYQQFAQGLSAPTAEPMQALRLRAVSRLADRLPGGILTVGKGKDAEKIDLRTMEGIQQALELAPQSPEVMEAMTREAQEAGGGYPELERYMFRGIVTPGMGVTVGNRIYRRRAELGRTGFAELAKPTEGAATVDEEVDRRIKGQEPVYKKLQETSAALETQLEGIGKGLVEGRLAVEKWTAELLRYLQDSNKEGQAYREKVDAEQLEHLREMRQHAKEGTLTLKEFWEFVFTTIGQQALAEGTKPVLQGGGNLPPPADNTVPRKPQ